MNAASSLARLCGLGMWPKMMVGEAGKGKGWRNLRSAAIPLLYGENRDQCPAARACVCFHGAFYMQNPSRAETSVCFCRALGLSEHAVFLPNVNSVGNGRHKLCWRGVGGFKNKIAAVSP